MLVLVHIERIIFYEVTPRNVIKFSQQLGPSLKNIFKSNNSTFTIKTICNIGISMVMNHELHKFIVFFIFLVV